MPRYVYYCSICASHFQVRHGMSETQESCQLCLEPGHLTRVPQMPIMKNSNSNDRSEVGSLSKEYIEKNKDLLDEMKKEARGKDYDI